MTPEQQVLEALADLKERGPIQDLVAVETALYNARNDTLAAYGFNRETYRELKDSVFAELKELGKDDLTIDNVTLQVIPDKEIQYRIRRSSRDTDPTIIKERLKITIRE